MDKDEILEEIAEKKEKINKLNEEIALLNVELKKIKSTEKPFIVRVYINSFQNFKSKTFKTLKSAENFVASKCSGTYFEGYSNLGITISESTDKNRQPGEFLSVFFPVSEVVSNPKSPEDLKIYHTKLLIESLINLKNDKINNPYNISVENSYSECLKYNTALRTVGSEIKEKYLSGVKFDKNKYNENVIPVNLNNTKLVSKFAQDLLSESLDLSNVEVIKSENLLIKVNI